MFDWATLKRNRDEHVLDLNGRYARYLASNKVAVLAGAARFVGAQDGRGRRASATAPTTWSSPPADARSCRMSRARATASPRTASSSSEAQPRKVAIVGAGYIAVELAGVLHALGSEVTHRPAPRTPARQLRSAAARDADGADARGRHRVRHQRADRGPGEGPSRPPDPAVQQRHAPGRVRHGHLGDRACAFHPRARPVRHGACGGRAGFRSHRRVPADQRAGDLCDRRRHRAPGPDARWPSPPAGDWPIGCSAACQSASCPTTTSPP